MCKTEILCQNHVIGLYMPYTRNDNFNFKLLIIYGTKIEEMIIYIYIYRDKFFMKLPQGDCIDFN